MLVHGETGWHGGSYVYGDSTDDAVLAIAGAKSRRPNPRTNNYFVRIKTSARTATPSTTTS